MKIRISRKILFVFYIIPSFMPSCVLSLIKYEGFAKQKPNKFVKYNFDPRIHTLGNVGLGGAVHAVMAPCFTWILDKLVYNDRDVRYETALNIVNNPFPRSSIFSLLDVYIPSNHKPSPIVRILDAGCGTGISTMAFCQSLSECISREKSRNSRS